MIECLQPFIFPNFYLMNSRIHARVEVERLERLYVEILLYLTTKTNFFPTAFIDVIESFFQGCY